jgi:DNA-binding CsgD family transcriptional regulator/catechol 2,3-dioxygenase-like lactoylglutathione lyase family enzyme
MFSRRRRGRPAHDDVLTPAEWRVVHAVRHGMTNREIAQRRGISLDAVKYHVANAVAKLGLANRKALRKWSGAPKDSPLGRQELAMAVKLGPIGQVSRAVRDIKHAVHWYGDVLGLPHLYTFDKLAFFDCGGVRLFLSQQEKPSDGESIVYLRVDDINRAYEELQARGVEFTNAPHMIHRHADGTEEWMAFFKDPEGRPLAIMSQVKPAA